MVPITWDVLITIFFVVIVSYSFIIGRDGTIKIIIASYVGVLTANGFGNLAAPYIVSSNNPSLQYLGTTPEENIILFKIFLFVAATLILVLRGGFRIELGEQRSLIASVISTALYGLLSGALIVSIILTFVTGNQTDGLLAGITAENPLSLADKTRFFKLVVENYSLWFALPAAVFFLNSLLSRERE